MAELRYRGKNLAELQKLDLKDVVKLLPARQRRTLTRGVLDRNKPLLAKIKRAQAGQHKKPIKTHARDMIVLPDMVGMTFHIHAGNVYKMIMITEEMIGLFFGELVVTRHKVEHSAPGIGATKSSTAIATKAK